MKTINTVLVYGYIGAILGLEKGYYFFEWQWWVFFYSFLRTDCVERLFE